MKSLRIMSLCLCVVALAPERRRAGLAFTPEPRDLELGEITRAQFDALCTDPLLSVNFALSEGEERRLFGAKMSDTLLADTLEMAEVSFRDPDAPAPLETPEDTALISEAVTYTPAPDFDAVTDDATTDDGDKIVAADVVADAKPVASAKGGKTKT